MKILITQTDLQHAIVAYLTQYNIQVTADQISIDMDEVEINLNPEDTPTSTNPTAPKTRRRRTKAELEEANVQPVYPAVTNEPVPTSIMQLSTVEPVFTPAPSNSVIGDLVEEELSLSENIDEIADKPKAKEPESIFG